MTHTHTHAHIQTKLIKTGQMYGSVKKESKIIEVHRPHHGAHSWLHGHVSHSVAAQQKKFVVDRRKLAAAQQKNTWKASAA